MVTLGNTSVGKSSFIIKYIENKFTYNYIATLGLDFKQKKIKLKDGKDIRLRIFDTAGQERFKNIQASYYKGANGILVVYDITNRESFENLNSWLIEIEKNANKNVYKLLIGNKCDLEEKRKVSYQEGKDFAASNGMQFIETSAKADTKVKDAFELLTQEIIKSTITKDKGMEKKEKTIHLSSGTADLNTKKKSCC